MGDQLLPLPVTERTVHLCVDMQRIFSAEGPWPTPWMDKVLPVATKFAAAAKIACGRHVNDIGTRFSQVLFGGFQKLGRPVHMAAALRLALNLDAAQNPVLQ